MVTSPFSPPVGWGERYLKIGYVTAPAAAMARPARLNPRNLRLSITCIGPPVLIVSWSCRVAGLIVDNLCFLGRGFLAEQLDLGQRSFYFFPIENDRPVLRPT